MIAVSSFDEGSDPDDDDHSVDASTLPVEVISQEGSLTSALRMAVNPSPKATPVRQISVKLLSRLERICRRSRLFLVCYFRRKAGSLFSWIGRCANGSRQFQSSVECSHLSDVFVDWIVE
jgi:hypothetical protein